MNCRGKAFSNRQRLLWEHEVVSSNLAAPTKICSLSDRLRTVALPVLSFGCFPLPTSIPTFVIDSEST